MTNQQIIDNLKLQHNIPTHEPINTFKAWQSLGYQVNKGEKSTLKTKLWQQTKRKPTKETQTSNHEEQSSFILVNASLFTLSQVTKIKK